MELNERIKLARTRAGLTQLEVADHFDIKRPTVTQWEAGTHRPDQDRFAELASLLNVTLDWLISESGPGPDAQRPAERAATPAKFLRSSKQKFYVAEWREFMGVKVEAAARAAGMDVDEYQAREVYPINFTLVQFVALAEEFGIRGDQFWFPPPKNRHTSPQVPVIKKRAKKSGN